MIAGASLRLRDNSLNGSSSDAHSNRRQRILICTPSNIACDELVIRLHSQGVLGIDGMRLKDLNFVRIGSTGSSKYGEKFNIA